MDITNAIAPRSDQLNADDLLTGARTFRIEKVTEGSAEQPVNVHLAGLPGRPYRPSKSMLRVLAHVWSKEASAWAGHSLTLFRNPDITFGREKVGGIEIEAMTGLEKPVTLSLTATRGKKRTFTVEPLKDAPAPQPARDWVSEARQFTTVDDIRAHWVEAKAGGATAQQLADIQALATTTQQEEPA